MIPMMYYSPLLRNLHERRIAALAAAASFPLIDCGSEARGYGVAVFATTTALHSAARFLDGRRPGFWRRVFAASAVGGLLAHATFLFLWIVVLAWTWSQRPRIPEVNWCDFTGCLCLRPSCTAPPCSALCGSAVAILRTRPDRCGACGCRLRSRWCRSGSAATPAERCCAAVTATIAHSVWIPSSRPARTRGG
jgi:hypothetical protein